MKPIVGVMPLWDDEKDSIWMLPGYMDGIIQAGGIPIMFPFTSSEQELDQLMGICNGVLLTGGHDVSPELYHEEPLGALVDSCAKRDAMESIVLELALARNKPLLGICRGIQFINAALGGTLYQDLPTQHPSAVEHHQHAPYDSPVHEVDLVAGSPLHNLLEADRIPVNSYHHQAVRDIAKELKPMAFSSDGLVEALYLPNHSFLWAVQWHPEFSHQTDVNSKRIFSAFIAAMR